MAKQMKQSNRHLKCARGFEHEWDDYKETRHHIIKQCVHCKQKWYKCRRN